MPTAQPLLILQFPSHSYAFMEILHTQNSTVSLKAAGEKVRTYITLKEIETLSYSSGSVNDLVHLNDQLQSLKSEFETKLPHLE